MLNISIGLSRLQTGGVAPPPPSAADHIITNDAEWDALFALPAGDIAGDVIEVQGSNFTPRTIANKAFASAGGAITIRSADANAKIPHLRLQGLVTGITCDGLNIQLTGWPCIQPDCLYFATGNYDAITLKNCSFRHGYGAGLANIDTAAQLPEYNRIDNVQTATTTSATHSLTWQDSAADDGEVYFFNRGSEDAYVAVGGSGVTASTSNQLCPAGVLTRINGRDPTADTHFAIISASGTSEINARTEIGLGYYLGSGVGGAGGTTFGSLRIEGCTFTDLADGFKPPFQVGTFIFDRNVFRRVYQDLVNFSPIAETGRAWITRNQFTIPFSKAGIAENLDGDARDPHGDLGQVQSNGAGVIRKIRTGGNYLVPDPVRTGTSAQGWFFSDNDHDPSFDGTIHVADMLVAGSPNGISSGESGFPLGDFMAYAVTAVDPRDTDATSGAPSIRLETDGNYTVSVLSSISHAISAVDAAFDVSSSTELYDEADPNAIFPNAGDFLSATDRASLAAAMSAAGSAVGQGAAAAWAAGVIDFSSAVTAENCIDWSLVPSAPNWSDLSNQAASSQVELPLRRILNPRASQSVSVGAGVEWRSTQADGTTEVQGWASSAGTIEPDQMIQIRGTTASSGLTDTVLNYALNGIAQTVTLSTGLVVLESLKVEAAPSYFSDPANLPSGTRVIEFEGKFWVPTRKRWIIFGQSSTGCDLRAESSGELSLIVEAASPTGQKVVSQSGIGVTWPTGEWFYAKLRADYDAQQVTATINDQSVVFPFNPQNTSGPQLNRKLAMLAIHGSTPANFAPDGTRVADLQVSLDGVVRKLISNDPAIANADPWRRGNEFTGVVVSSGSSSLSGGSEQVSDGQLSASTDVLQNLPPLPADSETYVPEIGVVNGEPADVPTIIFKVPDDRSDMILTDEQGNISFSGSDGQSTVSLTAGRYYTLGFLSSTLTWNLAEFTTLSAADASRS